MMLFTPAQIEEVKNRSDLVDVATELGAVLRKSGTHLVGSCPICGPGRNPKTATRFKIDQGLWMCAVCSAGGDVIALVQKASGCSFASAVDRLGGTKLLTPAEEAKLTAERAEKAAAQLRQAEQDRVAEINRCRDIWAKGRHIFNGGAVADYLVWRAVGLPQSAQLREVDDFPYYHGEETKLQGQRRPRVIHRGPALLAALWDNAGVFCGLHITWLAPGGQGKAEILDPDTGERLASKKMRGHKLGGHIVLRQPALMLRLFLSEGIETGLAVATALKRQGLLLATDGFWAAGDLGNLGGPAACVIDHPLLKTKTGRPCRLPGPVPGSGPAIIIPESVGAVVLLGDGDSEKVLTDTTLERSRRRHQAPNRVVAIAKAPDGFDFDDLMMGKTHGKGGADNGTTKQTEIAMAG